MCLGKEPSRRRALCVYPPPPLQFFRDTNGEFVTNIRLLAPGLPGEDGDESKAVHEGLRGGMMLGSPAGGGVGAGVGAGAPGDVPEVSGVGGGGGVAAGDWTETGFTTFR